MRPLTVLVGILAAAAIVAAAAEVSSTAQQTSRIQQEVVTPGKLVRSDLPGALAAGGDTLSDSVARTDPLSEKVWDLTVNARENWYAAETPEAFAAYVSTAEALLAAETAAVYRHRLCDQLRQQVP